MPTATASTIPQTAATINTTSICHDRPRRGVGVVSGVSCLADVAGCEGTTGDRRSATPFPAAIEGPAGGCPLIVLWGVAEPGCEAHAGGVPGAV